MPCISFQLLPLHALIISIANSKGSVDFVYIFLLPFQTLLIGHRGSRYNTEGEAPPLLPICSHRYSQISDKKMCRASIHLSTSSPINLNRWSETNWLRSSNLPTTRVPQIPIFSIVGIPFLSCFFIPMQLLNDHTVPRGPYSVIKFRLERHGKKDRPTRRWTCRMNLVAVRKLILTQG